MKSPIFALIFAIFALNPHAQAASRIFYERETVRAGKLFTANFGSSGFCEVIVRSGLRDYPAITPLELAAVLGRRGLVYTVEGKDTADPKINCHGFTCDHFRIPHLPREVWINPGPMRMLVDTYFKQAGPAFTPERLAEFGVDDELRDGDMVVVVDRERFQHSGVIRKVNGENWVVHKLGEDMAVHTPVEGLVALYSYQEVRVYRRK